MAFIAPIMAAAGPLMTAMSAVGGIVAAAGSIQQGNAAAKAAEYNAQAQRDQAVMAQNQGAAQVANEVRKNRQMVANSQAAGLENGLELTGTTQGVINQARDTGTLNALLAAYDGSVKATGYRNNATLDLAQAKASRTAGYIGAASSALGGASDAYRTYQLSA